MLKINEKIFIAFNAIYMLLVKIFCIIMHWNWYFSVFFEYEKMILGVLNCEMLLTFLGAILYMSYITYFITEVLSYQIQRNVYG